MKYLCIFWIFTTFLTRIYIAPPVPRVVAQEDKDAANTDGLTSDQAQDQEYFRYLTQVIQELEKDEKFREILNNTSEDDIKSGKLAEHIDLVGHNVREKLDEVKRMEVEYQRELLRQRKDHMVGIDRNYWNPIHHDNQATFEKDDLKKLLSKHNDMMVEQDEQRKEKFKEHEIEKEHKRRQAMKNMTEELKKEEMKKDEDRHHKKHEKIHEPGHKAQLEEVWEDVDGIDADFDPKTFFNLHDKNSDGYLDQFELKTLFLHDIDKIYNDTDPDIDPMERDEEMERMREHVMKSMDLDKDGLVSLTEFMTESKSEEFEHDEDWKSIPDEEQFTEEELKEYEQRLEKEEQELMENHGTDHENERRGEGEEKADEHTNDNHINITAAADSNPVKR